MTLERFHGNPLQGLITLLKVQKTMQSSVHKVRPPSKLPAKELLLLWGVSIIIAVLGLGDLPLRDFDEGIVARVALELTHHKGAEVLLPKLWDAPYLNKPPGLHWLIAAGISLNHQWEPSNSNAEMVVRLIPSLISTLIVPLGGLVQWQLLKHDKSSCLSTSAILLTILPIARHGRLAMLDGSFLSAMALLWLLLLANDRSPMDKIRMLGVGLVSSSMLLLKAPLILPAWFAAVIPIAWGKEFNHWWRGKLSIWLAIGLIPGFGWHLWHGLNRGAAALWLWGGDGAGRVLFDAGEGSDLGWKVPVIEILEGGWPWLALWPIAIVCAWQARNRRWGRWSIGSLVVLMMAILPLKTQLPWYSHPLWLPFALICGPLLGSLIERDNSKPHFGKKYLEQIPLFWLSLGIFIFFFGSIASTGLIASIKPYSSIALAIGIGWTLGGLLLINPERKKRKYGAFCLIAGNLSALALLMGSPLWLWELNENWPVKPVAELATATDSREIVIEGSEERPSLNWYAEKRIKRLKDSPDSSWILTRNPKQVQRMHSPRECTAMQTKELWTLLFCESKSN